MWGGGVQERIKGVMWRRGRGERNELIKEWEVPCCHSYLELEGRSRNLSFNLCFAIFSGSTDCALAGITLLLAEWGVEEGVPMAVPGRRGIEERVLLGVGMRLLDVDLNSSVCVCVCVCMQKPS